eukprot:328281_1
MKNNSVRVLLEPPPAFVSNNSVRVLLEPPPAFVSNNSVRVVLEPSLTYTTQKEIMDLGQSDTNDILLKRCPKETNYVLCAYSQETVFSSVWFIRTIDEAINYYWLVHHTYLKPYGIRVLYHSIHYFLSPTTQSHAIKSISLLVHLISRSHKDANQYVCVFTDISRVLAGTEEVETQQSIYSQEGSLHQSIT